MAKTEGEFKPEFKDQIKGYYPEAVVWSSNDMFQSGIPDLNILWNGRYFSIEAKFVKEIPVRQTSKVLSHEVSSKQANHLKKIKRGGGIPVILIGMPDVLVWTTDIKPNYSLQEVMAMERYPKINGKWQLECFLDDICLGEVHG